MNKCININFSYYKPISEDRKHLVTRENRCHHCNTTTLSKGPIWIVVMQQFPKCVCKANNVMRKTLKSVTCYDGTDAYYTWSIRGSRSDKNIVAKLAIRSFVL